MIRDFSKEEEQAEEAQRDTELTLGGGTLLVLGGGLILLCILCFVLGYSFGHRTSSDRPAASVVPAPSSKSPVVAGGSVAKPTAAGQLPPRAPAQSATGTDAAGESGGPGQAVTEADKSESSSQPEVKRTAEPQVRPALQGQAGAAPSSGSLQVMPAMTKVQGWMVQIAAVSQPEDAEVLVNALRKRGYSVTARRETNDSLIHVQTGPFVNRNDANAMRQKLLNDGYNAIVQ